MELRGAVSGIKPQFRGAEPSEPAVIPIATIRNLGSDFFLINLFVGAGDAFPRGDIGARVSGNPTQKTSR